MSEVASLELCRELYELSGWDNEQYYDRKYGDIIAVDDYRRTVNDVPAYTLGFILRKLPKWLENDCFLKIEWAFIDSRNFQAGYWNEKENDWDIVISAKKWWGLPDNEPNGHNESYVKYMSPESLIANLAIELIKQNIITPKQKAGK